MIAREEFKMLLDGGKLPFREMPPNPDEQFYLDRCRHYYGLYSHNSLGVGFGGTYLTGSQRRSFTELRDHARGLQDVTKYKDLLDPKDKRNRRKWNISWDTLAILPKFRDIIKSKFLDLDLIPQTRAIDETARVERILEKNRLKILTDKKTQEAMSVVGVDATQMTEGFDNPEDVEMYYDMGGIRLAVEMMMKDGMDKVLSDSRWEVLKEMLIEDIIDLGGFAVDEILVNGRLEYKYVDLARVIMRPSVYPDYRDSDFRGYIEFTKVSELRNNPGLAELDLKSIQKKYANYQPTGAYLTNANWGSGYREDYAGANMSTYNDFGVEVMTVYFVDTQVHNYVVGTHARGSKIFEPVAPDFTLSERGQKQGKILEAFPLQYVFRCRWIVGTDIVFDYGPVDSIVRAGQQGSKRAKFPMTLFISHEPSLIERCISFDDDVQLANFKIRSVLAKLPPAPRMIVDKSKLRDSVSIAGEEYSILDMITNYQSEGLMVVESLDEYGLPGAENDSNRMMPFSFMPSGITEDIQILEQRIQLSIDKIRQVTGINEVTDGTTKRPDMLITVAQSMQQAANAALRPHIKMYIDGFREMCTHTMQRLQNMVLAGAIDMGTLPVSDMIFKQVRLTRELINHDWGVIVDVLSTDNKQYLLQMLLEKREQISEDNFFAIFNSIQQGDFKKAQLLIAKAVRVAKDEARMEQLQMIQANAQAQMQSAQAAAQMKMQEKQVETQLEAQMKQLAAQLEEMKAQQDHQRSKEFEELKQLLMKDREIEVVRENNQNRLQT